MAGYKELNVLALNSETNWRHIDVSCVKVPDLQKMSHVTNNSLSMTLLD